MSKGRAAEQPNILVLMTDQQRYDSLGCYGIDWVKTPNLDRLAAEGVVFDNYYATNPVCTPSRASLFTGKHLPGHGVYKLHDILPEEEICFTKRLQQRGYHTALFGKMHVSGRIYEEARRHPNDGFDVYEWCLEAMLAMDSPLNGYAPWLKVQDPEFHDRLKAEGRKLLHHPRELHLTHWAAERTIDYIRGAPKDRPFFCKMSVFDPHNPYEDYPREMLELVDEKRIPPPVRRPKGEKRPQGILMERNHSYLGGFDRFTHEDFHKMRLGYFASLALFDLEVGRVLEALERQGLAENTLVIMTSDHGDMLGDQELLVKGAFFYDPCVKIPLIMRWPGHIPAGVRTGQLAQIHDLAATSLAAAGFSQEQIGEWMPEAMDLIPLSSGGGGHGYAVCCYRNSGISDRGVAWDPPIHCTMFRDSRYKLNVYHGEQLGELYDMQEDPQELNNLWDHPDYAKVRLDLTDKLVEWMFRQELANDARGGEAIPDPKKRLVNALK
jgi:arylsulfatase A-like enzyme